MKDQKYKNIEDLYQKLSSFLDKELEQLQQLQKKLKKEHNKLKK